MFISNGGGIMKFKVQIVIDDGKNETRIEDILQLEKSEDQGYCAGLSLDESKAVLKILQQKIILCQAQTYVDSQRSCPDCHNQRHIKGYHTIQYRTLFGIVVLPSPRLCHCQCIKHPTKTFSPLTAWLPEHCSPELQYIETKWASYMSFDKTAQLLQDVLPVSTTINDVTIRNHLHKIAKRQESELEGKPVCISGCANDWAKLPKPDKPLTVGIDGGYIRSWENKKDNFEVIVGKCFSSTQPAKRFGFVQSLDDKPQRRLLYVLREQGMQENQQITFLSDGADNVRELQYIMHPEAEHVLDWFHLTMRFTVLNQFAKGLTHTDPDAGNDVAKHAKSAKWYLWHGNVKAALDQLDECYIICMDEELAYKKRKKLEKHIEELMTYVKNNQHLIPNYGERYRYGETITTSFVESTVNEVVTKRMVKKQQMQWTPLGAHYLLQARSSTLSGDLEKDFKRWYKNLSINDDTVMRTTEKQKAA